MKRCSSCDYAKWSSFFSAYTCKHEKGLGIIFRGKTKPHKCPLVESGKYFVHGNSSGYYGIKVSGYHK